MASKILTYYKELPISIKKIVLACIAVSVFFILKSYTNHLVNQYYFAFSWRLISLKIIATYLMWALLTPLVYRLLITFYDKKTPVALRIIKFIIGCVLLAAFHRLITSRIVDVINYFSSGYLKAFLGQNNIVALIIGSFSSFIELLVIVSVFLASDYQTKYIENQKVLVAAQLSALRMQLHPHFLFNTLHSIASMIDIDTKNAQKMVTRLGSLLRRMLEYNEKQMVLVQDELNFIRDYLDLEQVRYQDRVQISYNISEETLEYKIPNMIFQPLVENAVKHGIIPTLDHGEINIKTYIEKNIALKESTLVLQITNTFNSQNKNNKPISTGVGLVNIKKRLFQLYNEKFQFSAKFVTPDFYEAKISLPLIK